MANALQDYSGEDAHIVGIVGGAVAGSEAAKRVVERGGIAIVFEQGVRPYGKIEDGLPRWHEKLRLKEYEKIDENLSHEGVYFVPSTRIGDESGFGLDDLRRMGLSALLLANGAWRDRPLPLGDALDGIEEGLLYQNAFIHYFNHYHEAGYDGPRYEIPDGAIVVGGGLASIDVVKVINLELYRAALAKRGIDIDVTTLEVQGVPKVCEKHGLEMSELGVEGCTLYYRRAKEDMPLATADSPTPEQLEKLKAARVKIMDRVIRKYGVHFVGNAMPSGVLREGNRLTGLRFRRTEIVDGRVRGLEGPDAEFEVRAPLVVSSIGSVPDPIPGLPTRGELYDFSNWDTGEVRDMPGVFGLGNVLTGKGNIRDSRKNAIEIAEQMASRYLGVGAEDDALSRPSIDVTAAVERALSGAKASPGVIQAVGDALASRHEAIGYTSYEAWMSQHAPTEA